MAKVHIHSGQGAVGTGDLQLQNGAPMDATLRPVTDAANTASPLELSTGLVAVTSTLQIATNDTDYIDAEDGSGNNRFTVSRASGSQVVNVDYASNPTSATDQVGAIRTYADGANLSDAVSFLRNGNVGIGTASPSAKAEIANTDTSTYSATAIPVGAVISRKNNSSTLNQAIGLRFDVTGWSGSTTGVAGISAIQSASNSSTADLAFQTRNAGTIGERMRITAAGNVGIGTSTPLCKLDVAGDSPQIAINRTTGNQPKLSFNLNSNEFGSIISNAASGENRFSIGPSVSWGGYHTFYTDTTEKMRITSDGYLRLASGSGGIQFNGDFAAANALDDYEEGTWTPSVFFGTSSTGFVYAAQLGKYTKIGNSVTVEFGFTLTTKGSGTGPVKISGLPFTHASSYRSGMSIGNVANLTFVNQFFGFVEGNSTDIYLRETTNVGVTTDITNADFANNTTLYGTISYLV